MFFILTFFILYSKIKPVWQKCFQFLKIEKIEWEKGVKMYFLYNFSFL